MTPVSPEIERALGALRAMLEADGYGLALSQHEPGVLVAEITAGPFACEECLVPKDMMRLYFDKALDDVPDVAAPYVRLVYPADKGGKP